MPRLEVRLTDRQMQRLMADAKAAGMNRSDWVRFCVLREEPVPKGQHQRRATGLRERAEKAREAMSAAPDSSPPPVVERPPEPLLTPQSVALQAGISYFTAAQLIEEGRVRQENGHLIVDGRAV